MYATDHYLRKTRPRISMVPKCIVVICTVFFSGFVSSAATPAQPLTLAQVRSYVYVIAVDLYSPTLPATIAACPYDLVILGGGEIPIERRHVDLEHKKLLLGYIDTCEGAPYWYPHLFKDGAPPSWFGKQVPGYDRLYSVQYWNPQWKPLLLHRIDQVITAGYDGIFLDVLDGHLQWSEGNRLGNPTYSNGIPALASLLNDIRGHIEKKKRESGRPLFILGNGPTGIAEQFPDSLENLDGIFCEWLFWRHQPDNGTRSVFAGTENFEYMSSRIAPIYNRTGLPVFGNDYPLPLSDKEEVTKAFDFYSSIGWVSSVTNALQDTRIFSSGPFLFTATPLNPEVVGTKNFVNYLSGGKCQDAVLVGGDRGDVFIGGGGKNVVRGGNGDDLIYAHPSDVVFKNRIRLTVVADVKNSPNPVVSISVNGKVVKGPIPVTATFENRTKQTIVIDVTSSDTVRTIEIAGDAAPYLDQNHYANIQIMSLSFMGQPLDFKIAQYSSDSKILNDSSLALLNHKSRILFPHSAIPRPSVTFGSATDNISGGAGTDTVVYRAAAENYTVKRLGDSSFLVTSEITNEGPDTLLNVEYIRFSDKQTKLSLWK